MSLDYNLLKIFVKLAETGSFTGAAKILNQPKSRVSRSIARLEENLGVQLVRRTTRKTTLTSSGLEFYNRVSPLLLGIANEITRVSDEDKEMSGLIKVTAPDSIAESILSGVISAFSKKYPEIVFDTVVTNEKLDLLKEEIDLAFRAGKLEDSSLIQKKLLKSRFILTCSPGYLVKYGEPKSLKELESHKLLIFKPIKKDSLSDLANFKESIQSDSLSMLRSLALSSEGITMLPDFYCREYLESGSLIQILPKWSTRSGYINMLYPSAKTQSKRVKLFIEKCKESYSS